MVIQMELEKFLKEYDNPPDGNRLYRITSLCETLKKVILASDSNDQPGLEGRSGSTRPKKPVAVR
jgi:hypothetical protein